MRYGVWRLCLEPRGRRTECDWSWVFPELESVISSYSMATVMPAADQILHMLFFQSWTGGQAFWKQFSLKHISLSLGALWLVTSCPPAAGSHGLGITNFSFFQDNQATTDLWAQEIRGKSLKHRLWTKHFILIEDGVCAVTGSTVASDPLGEGRLNIAFHSPSIHHLCPSTPNSLFSCHMLAVVPQPH